MSSRRCCSDSRSIGDCRDRQLAVYCFRTTARCPSCVYIESTTQVAVKDAFAEELKSGRVVLKTVNRSGGRLPVR